MKKTKLISYATSLMLMMFLGASGQTRNASLAKQFIDEVAKPYGTAVQHFKDLASSNEAYLSQQDSARKNGYVRINDDNERQRYFAEMQKLQTAAQLCTTKFGDLRPVDLSYYDVKGICLTAINAPQIYHTGVRIYLTHSVLQNALHLDQQKNMLAKNDGFITHPWATKYLLDPEKIKAEIREKKAAEFQAVGAVFPADYFAPLDAKAAEIWSEIERLAPTFSLPATTEKDAVIEALAKKTLMKTPGVRILKTGMTMTTWKISTNNLGIPTYRSKYGYVLYQVPGKPGEKLCRYRGFNYNEQYAGAGTYAKADSVDLSERIRFQKCQ